MDIKSQESQKTIVAFVAGLLIGGLLVWVFSSSFVDAPLDERANDDTEESTRTTNTTPSTNEDDTAESPTDRGSASAGAVADQRAGNEVMLGDINFPTDEGWVVVRDYNNGVSGNVLGAARYDVDGGLVPASVSLLRATEAGKTYQVVFLNENGDKTYNAMTDTEISGPVITFTAN